MFLCLYSHLAEFVFSVRFPSLCKYCCINVR